MKTSIRFSLFGIALTICVLAFGFSCCKGGNEPQPHNSKTQITPEGGVYTLNNGVTLVVPAGAVDENTTVKVEYAEDLDESKGALPGDIYGQLHFSPEGLTFNKPVEVSMPLNQPAVGDSATIVYWVPDSARWYISDIGCVQNGKVTFYVDHFSDYAAEVDNWMAVFSVMDSYVGSATSEEAISDAVGRYLETELWEKMGIKDLRIATRVNMGGQAVNTCVQACGIYGFWAEVKDSVLVRQGGKMFKEESPCNAYTIIGIHTSYLSSHLYGLLQNGEKRHISDRLLEINYKPCEIRLQGSAKDSKIDKGKTTEVTITAQCGEEPLRDQLIQLQYSPELSCDVVNKKTDANGQVKITVKGVEEGKGIVYAKAVSAVDADFVTEIQVPVKVGGGENWRITYNIQHEYWTSFGETTADIWVAGFQHKNDDQKLVWGYELVMDIIVSGNSFSGKAKLTNNRSAFQYSASAFSQSGYIILDEPRGWRADYSSSLSVSAAPQYNDWQEVSIYGTVATENDKLIARGFLGKDQSEWLASTKTEAKPQWIFFAPNITGSWSAKTVVQTDETSTTTDGGSVNYTSSEGRLASLAGMFFVLELKEQNVDSQNTVNADALNMSGVFVGSADYELNDTKWDEVQKLHMSHTLMGGVGFYPSNPIAFMGSDLIHGKYNCSMKVEKLSEDE